MAKCCHNDIFNLKIYILKSIVGCENDMKSEHSTRIYYEIRHRTRWNHDFKFGLIVVWNYMTQIYSA